MMTNGSKEEVRDLVKETAAERTLVVRELAATSGRRAEEALMAIAVRDGDQAAMAVLGTLNPIEIGKIIKEHDFSIPSAAAWLADPLIIAEMLAMDPVEWQKIKFETHVEDIVRLQEDALNLLATILLTTDDQERQKQVLAVLAENDNAFFYLCFPFIGQSALLDLADSSFMEWHADQGVDEENVDVEKGVQPDSNYRQQLYDLFKLIDSLAPELALRMRSFIGRRQGEEMTAWQAVFNSIVELREVALAQIQSADEKSDEEEYDDMFEK